MRILIVSSWFARTATDSTLVNDLAIELTRHGHEVVAYAQDWSGKFSDFDDYTESGVRVLWVPSAASRFGAFRLVVKWIQTSRNGWNHFSKELLSFDPEAIISIGACTIHHSVIKNLVISPNKKSLFIQWDFFPFHHFQIGKFYSRLLLNLLAKIESRLIDRFDFVAHMTPGNVAYFRSHYPTVRHPVSILLPIWGPALIDSERILPRDEVRRKHGLAEDKTIVIFGGQLSKGRGIENIFSLAERASRELPQCQFVIIGDGELRAHIEQLIAGLPTRNIVLKGRVPRSEYQRLVAACDIGIVSTSGGVDAPTFPSKSIDYMRNSVPILASVEEATDFRSILENAGAGLVNVAGDNERFFDNLRALAANVDMRKKIGAAGRQYFKSHLHVSIIVRRIEKLFGRPK